MQSQHPKLMPGVPDFYEVTVCPIGGRPVDFNVVNHVYDDKKDILLFLTTENEEWHFPLAGVSYIKLGKTWRVIKEMRAIAAKDGSKNAVKNADNQ